MEQQAARPILPAPNSLTQFFWDGVKRRQLLIQRCDDCGFYVHWPRPLCKRCLSFSLSPNQVSGRGTLYTYTVTVQPFHPWFADRVPYVLASVELEEQKGLKFVSNLIDCPEEEIEVGMALETVFQEVAEGLTLPMVRRAGG